MLGRRHAAVVFTYSLHEFELPLCYVVDAMGLYIKKFARLLVQRFIEWNEESLYPAISQSTKRHMYRCPRVPKKKHTSKFTCFILWRICSKHWAVEPETLRCYVNTRPTIQERSFLCGSHRDHCYSAVSAPMDGLGSDHVGTPTDTHATIEELCFQCEVRAERM
jgi:hypothetical protein